MLTISVDASLVVGATEVLLDAVFVDSPEAVDALMDSFVVDASGDQQGCNKPEDAVLGLNLEQSYTVDVVSKARAGGQSTPVGIGGRKLNP